MHLGITLPAIEEYAVGMVFFPKELRLREECRDIFNRAAEKMGMRVIHWRSVPVNNSGIGPSALNVEPAIEQVFIERPSNVKTAIEFERKLFVLRKYATHITGNAVKKTRSGFTLRHYPAVL
nr:hypothetical protein [Niabella hibiscisoli]